MKNYRIVISPKEDYYKSINYCFGKENVEQLEHNEGITKISELSTRLSDVSNIVFYTLSGANDILFNMLPTSTKKYIIFPYSITELSDPKKMNELLLIIRYIDMKILAGVYCIEYNTYLLFKEKYKFNYMKLDINTETEANNSNSIGIIARPNDYYSTIVNELSAITLTENSEVRLLRPLKVVSRFAKRFKLNVQKANSIDDVIRNNKLNLYINFSATCYTFILESMDMGIPCIVGNTDFFDSNELLKKYLVVRSDDDINEMKEKIELVEKNSQTILKEYEKFRKEYKKAAKKSIEEFKNSMRWFKEKSSFFSHFLQKKYI